MHITAGVAEPSIVCWVPGATFYGWLLRILCGTESETARGGDCALLQKQSLQPDPETRS